MAQAPQSQPQQGGLAAAMPNAAAVADQFQNQQKPFGWLMDMIQHITGQMQPQAGQPAASGQPVNQPQTQQQQTPPPGAGQGTNPQPQGQKQSQAQPAQPGMQQPGMIDPATVQQLVSLFQPNALSNLGLLPQQQGSWNWVLSMMQQGQAAQAQQKGMGGNDLISLVRQLGGQTSGSMVPEAGGTPKPAAKTPAKG